MPCKICKDCGKPSFSSYSQGSWVCPYCGCDLTELELAENKQISA